MRIQLLLYLSVIYLALGQSAVPNDPNEPKDVKPTEDKERHFVTSSTGTYIKKPTAKPPSYDWIGLQDAFGRLKDSYNKRADQYKKMRYAAKKIDNPDAYYSGGYNNNPDKRNQKSQEQVSKGRVEEYYDYSRESDEFYKDQSSKDSSKSSNEKFKHDYSEYAYEGYGKDSTKGYNSDRVHPVEEHQDEYRKDDAKPEPSYTSKENSDYKKTLSIRPAYRPIFDREYPTRKYTGNMPRFHPYDPPKPASLTKPRSPAPQTPEFQAPNLQPESSIKQEPISRSKSENRPDSSYGPKPGSGLNFGPKLRHEPPYVLRSRPGSDFESGKPGLSEGPQAQYQQGYPPYPPPFFPFGFNPFFPGYPYNYFGFPYSYGYPGYPYQHPVPRPAVPTKPTLDTKKTTRNFKCPSDGYFYREPTSFFQCYDGDFTVQFCAPGSRNYGSDFYKKGADHKYDMKDFCSVNMAQFAAPAFPVYNPPSAPAAYTHHSNQAPATSTSYHSSHQSGPIPHPYLTPIMYPTLPSYTDSQQVTTSSSGYMPAPAYPLPAPAFSGPASGYVGAAPTYPSPQAPAIAPKPQAAPAEHKESEEQIDKKQQ